MLGFADRCLTTRPRYRVFAVSGAKVGFIFELCKFFHHKFAGCSKLGGNLEVNLVNLVVLSLEFMIYVIF